MAKFGEPSIVIAQKKFFMSILTFFPQMTLKGRVEFHHIQSHPRSIQDAPIGQIW